MYGLGFLIKESAEERIAGREERQQRIQLNYDPRAADHPLVVFGNNLPINSFYCLTATTLSGDGKYSASSCETKGRRGIPNFDKVVDREEGISVSFHLAFVGCCFCQQLNCLPSRSIGDPFFLDSCIGEVKKCG